MIRWGGYMKLSRLYSTTFPLLFLAVFCLNSFVLKQPILGATVLVVYLFWCGNTLGNKISMSNNRFAPSWIGTWTLLSIMMMIGSFAYYIASVPAILFQVLVILSIGITWMNSTKQKKTEVIRNSLKDHLSMIQEKILLVPHSVLIAVALILLFLGILFQIVQSHPILDAVRSPWVRIDVSVLLLFIIAATLIFTLLYRGRERTLSIFLFILLLGSLFSFAAIAYPIGFGFDSFIHKATEVHLAQFGTISPKPFYYIGQYSLVLFFSHAFSLPIDLVDTFLVPILAALLIPLAWYTAAVTITKNPRHALFTLVGIFLLPIESFIVTTPQGLANLWTLLAILACVPFLIETDSTRMGIHEGHPYKRFVPLACGTVATMLIHPISGIPIFFFFCLLVLTSENAAATKSQAIKIVRRFLFWVVVAAATIVLPANFLANAITSHQALHLDVQNLNPISLYHSLNLDIFFQNRFSPLLDFVYLYGQNALLIVFLISAFAFFLYRRDLSKRFRVLLLMILILGINYLLLANVIDFSFLIDYERSNYAVRLLPLMAFFLSPFLILALGHISVNIRTRPIILKLTLIVLASTIAASAFYLAFPRQDAYTLNHGFNTSMADVDAVFLIESWANKSPYIVLANQSVSAAAIKNIGFRYYGNLFFYPIPTGEAMYQEFLSMNTAPTKKIASEATGLLPSESNVHTVFYVVDTYWSESDRIIETAKSVADDWKSVDGSVYIFRFDLGK